jgi:predicted dehydrogenase
VQLDRVLIVGLGSIGKLHLRIARDLLPSADIRVMRHQSTDEIPKFANGCFFTVEECLAFSPNVAVIASPAPFHLAVAQALASAGVHLLIEKPLSTSLNGVTELLETCRTQRIALLTGYNLRFLPSLQRYRELISEGFIGKVLSVRCEIGQYLPLWRPECDYRQGVTANKKLGGGALLELSHEVDYLSWIFGEVKWVTAIQSRQSCLDIDVEDTAHLIMGFAPQAVAHQLIATLNLDLIRHDTTRACIAIGETGSLRWDGLTGQVMVYSANGTTWRELFHHQHQRDDSYQAEWKNFLACVSGSETPVISGEDGLRVLEIIEAARNSAASDGRVTAVVATEKPQQRDL